VTPTLWARFQQEARVVANLDHPHIVPIYDYGDIEDRLCLVMKLLPGGSLGDRIARGPLPWAEVVRLTSQVARALDYAHERGLVHRDIKPENVLLDDEGNAVLGDFGLVRALESGRLTTSLSGGVLGTPAYIAPEVWDGQAGTRYTDIYRLACLVYEMITGAQLFDAPTPPATMTLHFRPPQFPQQWPEGTPPGVDRILRQALAHNPEERYATAGEFARALAQLAADALAAPYDALQAAMVEGKWQDAVALAESILDRAPGYRDTRALLAEATAARAEAERAAWAAQWQSETEIALAAGDWSRALTAAQRWQSFAPEDVAAEAAIEQARQALAPPPAVEPEALEASEETVRAAAAPAPPDELIAPGVTPGGTAARGLAPAALPDEIPPADAGTMAALFWQRLRSRPALLGAAALLVIAVAVAAILLTRGDGEEPEEATVGDEVTAALGESYEGALAADEIDRYFLSELGAPVAVVEVVPGSGLDVVLTAYDADGNQLQRVDENSAGGPEWLVVKPDGGKFDVSAFGPGSYTLLINDALPPGAGARLTGNTLGEGDWHNYPFDAPAGAQVAVVSEAQFDLALELWQGEEMLVERDSGDGYEQIVFTVPADGSYAVAARQHSGSGDYRLLLLTHPDVLADVALGDTRIGAFARDARYEYTLGVEPGTAVSVNAAPDNEANIVLEVKDSDGNLLASADDGDDGGSENLTFTVPGDGDGTVIIQLSELNGLNAGHFTLQIGEEPVDAVDVDTSRFVSELNGLRFEYPDSWSVAEGDFDPFVVALASDAALLEELLNDPDAAFQGALAAFQTGYAADLGGESLETVLAEMPAFTDLASDGEVTQPPEATTINGEEAAAATIDVDAPDGTRYSARYVLMRTSERFGLVLALAPLDQIDEYEPLLELVLQSLELHWPLEPVGKGGIAVGDSVSDAVAEGAYHAWHLAGSEGQPVRIAVEPGEGFDAMVDVRGDDGRSILDNGRVDSEGEGGAETVVVTFSADGEYLIYILGYEGSFGPYTLTVEPDD
jgi:hypothetical protein